MLFSKEKADLLAKIEALEASLAEANTNLAAANTEITGLREQLATAQADLTRQAAEHETALKAKEDEVAVRVNQGVIDGLAAAGVPQEKLPVRVVKDAPAANDFDARIEDLNAQIAEAKDPLEKGKLASQVLKIMEEKAAAAKN